MIKIKGMSEEKTCTISFAIVAVITSLLFRNHPISVVIGLIELSVVLFHIIKGRYDRAFLFFIFFLSSVIENIYFATGSLEGNIQIYGFENLPVSRTYHVLVLACFFLFLLITKKRGGSFRLYNWNILLVVLWCLSLIVTISAYLFDDNGIRSIWGLTRLLIIDAYDALLIIAVYVTTQCLMSSKKGFDEELKTVIIGILKGSVIASLVLILLGNTWRTEEGTIYIICPLIMHWSPSLLLFYRKEKRFSFIVYALLSVVVQIKCTVGIPGAWWITTGLIFASFTVEALRNVAILKKVRIVYLATTVIAFFAIMIVAFMLFSGENLNERGYIAYKLGTVFSIFSFSTDFTTWLYGLGTSVGIRVEEIINIFLELFNNPVMFITGKGFGGTIHHVWGVFNWDYKSAFSEVQRTAQIFSVFHTGVAEFIINFGIIGILFVLRWGKKLLKVIFGNNNPFLLIGLLYFLIFYPSFWCMMLCVVMMAYGVYIDDIA